VLTGENSLFVREDIAAEHWIGPPEEFVGWWRSTVKHIADNAPQPVSGETLQSLFEQLVERLTVEQCTAVQSVETDTLYMLTLLLLRRKLLRYEKEITDEQGSRLLEVSGIHTGITYHIPVAMPSQERLEAIQQQLAALTNA